MLPALQHILPGCELYDTMEQFGPPGKLAASGLHVGEQVTGNMVVGATEVAGDMLSGDVLSASGDVLDSWDEGLGSTSCAWVRKFGRSRERGEWGGGVLPCSAP